jgi:hypothetical protein
MFEWALSICQALVCAMPVPDDKTIEKVTIAKIIIFFIAILPDKKNYFKTAVFTWKQI